MTREWPEDTPNSLVPHEVPIDWPLAIFLAWLIAALVAIVFLVFPGALTLARGLAVPLAALAVLMLMAGLLRREEARRNARGETLFPARRWAVRRAPRRVLSACLRDADGVPERLLALELRGRARLCRDVAVRCLGEAARHRRLADRLAREAEGWLCQTKTNLSRSSFRRAAEVS